MSCRKTNPLCVIQNVNVVRNSICSGPPQSGSQHKGDSFAPEGQSAGDKRQRQEIGNEGEGDGNKGEGGGVFVSEGDCLWIERRQMQHIGKWVLE